MTEDDPKGDTKMDKLGNLLGGSSYWSLVPKSYHSDRILQVVSLKRRHLKALGGQIQKNNTCFRSTRLGPRASEIHYTTLDGTQP